MKEMDYIKPELEEASFGKFITGKSPNDEGFDEDVADEP